ncbi:hypothetical protein [Cardinium endosymbiont of Nabis limbatus]|uniref:hypothetical protein n=1 Tax=Cardinium endosymbiont of Nabis limbatus TaxID=3066217 RepID=UPI003AF34916
MMWVCCLFQGIQELHPQFEGYRHTVCDQLKSCYQADCSLFWTKRNGYLWLKNWNIGFWGMVCPL